MYDSSGRIIWGTQPHHKVYIAEAKRRVVSCRVGQLDSSFSRYDRKTSAPQSSAAYTSERNRASSRTNEQLCILATTNGQWDNRSNFSNYRAEAKLRGLSCGISETKPRSQPPQVAKTPHVSNDNDTDSYPDRSICSRATTNDSRAGKKIWDSNPRYAKYVREAKRRGLTCGVGEVRQKRKPKPQPPQVAKKQPSPAPPKGGLETALSELRPLAEQGDTSVRALLGDLRT
jgi:hypothetical protein